MFWILLEKEYPVGLNSVIAILLPFSTIYLCELSFFKPNLHQDEVQRATKGCGSGSPCLPLIHPSQNREVVYDIPGSGFPLIVSYINTTPLYLYLSLS